LKTSKKVSVENSSNGNSEIDETESNMQSQIEKATELQKRIENLLEGESVSGSKPESENNGSATLSN